MTKLPTIFLTLSLTAILAACGAGTNNDITDNTPDFTNNTPTNTGPNPNIAQCGPLPPPSGNIITINSSQAQQLPGIVSSANQGDTIVLEDGIYNLNGSMLWFSTPGVTLRSASGNPADVILDGSYNTTEIITMAASDQTVAEITLTRAFTNPIHVVSSNLGDTNNTLIYRVNIIDPREQAIKINPHMDGYYTDDGVIACSSLKLTDQGRPNVNPTLGGCYTGGIDAHQARGWTVRDNAIEGFWCSSGLSEYGIHFWKGGRDTLVERNILKDNARGIGFGLANSGIARTYNDNSCPQANGAYIGHYGGIIRNNFIHASSTGLLNSADGFDSGISLWAACNATVVHNTIVSTGNNFSSIEWRFAGSTGIEISNNIATHPLRERDGATANLSGNLENASLSLFIDGQNGDLHLASNATSAIDMGVLLAPGLSDFDIDDDMRDSQPDIGADEI